MNFHNMSAMVHANLVPLCMIMANLAMILPWSWKRLLEICQDHGKPTVAPIASFYFLNETKNESETWFLAFSLKKYNSSPINKTQSEPKFSLRTFTQSNFFGKF